MKFNLKYKNTMIAVAIIVLTLLLSQSSLVKSAVFSLGEWGYLGAFFSGIFFVSIFTVAPATLAIYLLASYLNPIEIALLAGLGAVLGDFVIFKFLKDGVFKELSPLFNKIFKRPIFKQNNNATNWLLSLLGILIIMSPFPDEIGISLLDLSKIKIWQFTLLSFVLNSAGIYLIVSAVKALS